MVAKLWHAAYRRCVFEQREVLVFRYQQESTGLHEACLRELSFKEIEDSASMYSQYLGGAYVSACEQRIERGDVAYTLCGTSEIQHIAWLGFYDQIADNGFTGADCTVDLQGSQPLIYNCWTPPVFRRQGVYKRVLSGFISMFPCGPLWIYCRRSNVASAAGIKSVGFELSHVLSRAIRFGRLSKVSNVCVRGK